MSKRAVRYAGVQVLVAGAAFDPEEPLLEVLASPLLLLVEELEPAPASFLAASLYFSLR